MALAFLHNFVKFPIELSAIKPRARRSAALRSSGDLDFDREVLRELLRLHAKMLLRQPWIQALLALGVVLLVYRSVPVRYWGVWAFITVAAECLRADQARRMLLLEPLACPESWHRRWTALAALVGASVGTSALCFMSLMPLPDQALLMIILMAMPAAGVSVAVSSPRILAAYAFFIMVPAAVSWIRLHPDHLLAAAGLITLYWAFIISVAGDGEQLLRRSVAIRRERDRSLADLQQRNEEVRAAVARAEESSRARARVLASASHDLRQPLHALSVYSAVLIAHPATESLPEVAYNIDRLVRNLGNLLHGLLDLSRLSADQYVPDLRRVSLDRLAADICNEFGPQVQDKQLRLVRELSHVRLFDDTVAVSRIIRNLIDNAIKYTEQGQITVTTALAGDAAVLIITDTGRGIPSEELQRIFEEFYQLENPGRDHERGIGLGLAIVQRLCELIGAEIKVTSSYGIGSKFMVTFKTVVSKTRMPSIQGQALNSYFGGKRIYVVDDEADILAAMRMLLESWGSRVETSASASIAEQLFADYGKPDLLIVDLRLAEEEQGVVFAERLIRKYGSLPVLILLRVCSVNQP